MHGKNHHRLGTFGRHVRALELLRSDSSRRVCSSTENPALYRATIGGLGLTGLITWAEIRLHSIANPFIDQETRLFDNLEAFFALAEASDRDYEHTVAWVDCLAGGRNLGRGVFIRGNHARGIPARPPRSPRVKLRVPCELPVSAVNRATLKLFNAALYRRHPTQWRQEKVHYASFFHPLDGIDEWNRIYGPRGFLQYQCVMPEAQGRAA